MIFPSQNERFKGDPKFTLKLFTYHPCFPVDRANWNKLKYAHFSPLTRGVAQPGSAFAWGAKGREFKSLRPDHFKARKQRFRSMFTGFFCAYSHLPNKMLQYGKRRIQRVNWHNIGTTLAQHWHNIFRHSSNRIVFLTW